MLLSDVNGQKILFWGAVEKDDTEELFLGIKKYPVTLGPYSTTIKRHVNFLNMLILAQLPAFFLE